MNIVVRSDAILGTGGGSEIRCEDGGWGEGAMGLCPFIFKECWMDWEKDFRWCKRHFSSFFTGAFHFIGFWFGGVG